MTVAISLTPDALLSALEDLSLDKNRFKHEQHVQVAWQLLRTETKAHATERFAIALKRFAAHHGVPDLYHETITLFYLNAVAERLAGSENADDWQRFRAENADLFRPFREFLKQFYSDELLESTAAKRHFLLPDKRGLAIGLNDIAAARSSDGGFAHKTCG